MFELLMTEAASRQSDSHVVTFSSSNGTREVFLKYSWIKRIRSGLFLNFSVIYDDVSNASNIFILYMKINALEV